MAAVDAVLRGVDPNEDVVDATFAGAMGSSLSDRDRGLARAITTVTLRRLGTIRHRIAAFMDRGYPRKCGALEAIMTTAAAQILFMDVPDHAAVDAAVSLAKADRNATAFSGLANAVLRRVASAPKDIDTDPLIDAPDWLAARWAAAFGEPLARAIALAHRQEAGLDVSVVDDAASWAERLDGMVLAIGPAASVTTSVRLRDTRPVTELAGFADGRWWVQDAAAALPARLLMARAGERIADLCAAPGGKTAQLAAMGAEVTAIDRSPERMARLIENLARLKLSATERVSDVLTFSGDPFDAVLLDAPCSATGTIRRHPDVAWLKRPGDIKELAGLQAALLDKAISLLKVGGRLVYSTCSLEPEEGEHQIEAALERHPKLARMPITAAELGLLADAVTADGDVRTLPPMLPDPNPRLAGLDGFYIARLVRSA